ncbi:MAG: stage IV sporulation protein A [Clostridia bacterium]|nr:stage IV sporulation protein A [Clostridia bacterium]
MSENSIYADIAKRTGGDIYIGVVGPVRTGKSTFIHRFLESVVMPNIEDEYDRQRTQDEMPQSASGRTIMTTEPKFVPDESVRVRVGEDTEFNVKMVDCVGYMVDGALGAEEDGEHRMVMTPWSEEEMPFAQAAELGTEKVIGEHATIAMLVTTDGTIADIPRESYIAAEERVVRELRERGKPFAIILNSAEPNGEAAHLLAEELEEKYGAPVALVCCPALNAEDIREILGLVLGEFPVREMTFEIPKWCTALPEGHKIRCEIVESIKKFAENVTRLGDIEENLGGECSFERVSVDAGEGTARFKVPVSRDEYYKYLSELCQEDIPDDGALLSLVERLADMKKKYVKVEAALADVEEKGYGIVMPEVEELRLEEPTLERSAGGYGVKISAHADSIHMIKTGIRAELCPVIGSEEQSREVVKFLTDEYGENPEAVWDYNMFGKSLSDMVKDGMNAKLSHMPDESREKLGETLGKIINEGSNGLICILL